MYLSETNSIAYDNRIKQLQKKREAIEKQTEMRKREVELNTDLDYEKIRKENELLIADKYNVEQRAVKLQEVYDQLKLKVMRQVGKIQVSSDSLAKHKQNIYDHMIRHKSKEADLFVAATNTKPRDYYQLMEDNNAYGPLVEQNDQKLEELKLQNEILKKEVELHKNQQQYLKEFSNNPHVDQDIIRGMVTDNTYNNRVSTGGGKNDRSSSQLSMETKQIMDHYNEKSQQNPKDNLHF